MKINKLTLFIKRKLNNICLATRETRFSISWLFTQRRDFYPSLSLNFIQYLIFYSLACLSYIYKPQNNIQKRPNSLKNGISYFLPPVIRRGGDLLFRVPVVN
jgi:hypothetical protein